MMEDLSPDEHESLIRDTNPVKSFYGGAGIGGGESLGTDRQQHTLSNFRAACVFFGSLIGAAILTVRIFSASICLFDFW